MMHDDLTTWVSRLEHVLRARGIGLFDRIFVFTETASTQDTAVRLSCGIPGAIVLAGRQTSGRGRLGRRWHSDGTLSATFVVRASDFSISHLSLAGGMAAAEAIERAIPAGDFCAAIRWPNDVVEAAGSSPEAKPGAERKLSGVLVEIVGDLAMIGIGINVVQEEHEWPDDVKDRAVSLRQLGSNASRIDVAEHLLVELVSALHMPREVLCNQWRQRNILQGRSAAFVCDGERYDGIVESLTPDLEIVVRCSNGLLHRLPAAHTSLVHEAQ